MVITTQHICHKIVRSPASCYRCDAACGSSSESALSFSAAGCDQRWQSEPQQCDRPLCRTVRGPTVHSATGVLPFCCALAIVVLCCPPAAPSYQCVVVSVLLSCSARCVSVRLAAAGQAQSDTNSQTADSATVTYKKVFKLFPVHPGPPRGEQCSSSVRALQSLGTYIRPAPWTDGARRRPRARAGCGCTPTPIR